jgi:tetratricopeptide (TPR) repeat protein
MSRGYGAVAARDFPAAQAAFEAALRMRPGDAPAKSALEQLVADSRIATVTALRDQALALENQEQWPAAVKRYEEALKLDPTGAPLLEGLARSRERADISRSLEQIVANADQLNDDAALTAARAAVQRARAVRDAGPVLTRQIGEAAGLIELAAIPVDVTFESDGVTDVVIYKVGKLGAFASKTLSLKPGSYVAVGTRQGYRDVRRSFRVAGGAPAPVVNLRCEEPI